MDDKCGHCVLECKVDVSNNIFYEVAHLEGFGAKLLVEGVTLPIQILFLLLAACGEKIEACSADLDSDNDGLDDCAEADLGTDPLAEDSDGDGFSDQAEVDCVSDPMNGDEACYACGWEHNDPGNIVSTGSAEGDVMGNASLVDQCGELVDLWDFYGDYHVLFRTAAW